MSNLDIRESAFQRQMLIAIYAMRPVEINNALYVAFLNAVLSNGATEIISVTLGSKCD